MNTNDLLQSNNESWAERNIAAPFREAVITTIYQPIANVANFCSKTAGANDILPKLDLSATTTQRDAARDPIEYSARLLTRAVVGATAYTICGKAASGLLKGAVGTTAIDSRLANVLTAESTGMILGAAAHDFCMNAKDGRERAANVLSGVAAFSMFEGLNKLPAVSGNTLKWLAAQPAIGVAGGAAGYITHEVVAGRKIDSAALGQAVLDGAALNVLMPAAKWSVSKLFTEPTVQKAEANWRTNIDSETRLAKQDMTISARHPSRRKIEIFNALKDAYTEPNNANARASFLQSTGEKKSQDGGLNYHWKEVPIPLAPDTLSAVRNRTIQRLPAEQRKFATFAVLEATLPTAIKSHGQMPPNEFCHAHGSIAEKLSPMEVHAATALYEARLLENIPHFEYLLPIAKVAEHTGTHPSEARKAMLEASSRRARQLELVAPNTDISTIQSFRSLKDKIIPAAGQTQSEAMQVVLQSGAGTLESMHKHQIPLSAVADKTVAKPMFDFIGTDISNLSGLQASDKLNAIARVIKADVPVTSNSLEATFGYIQTGGSLKSLNQDRIMQETRAYLEAEDAAVRSLEAMKSQRDQLRSQ